MRSGPGSGNKRCVFGHWMNFVKLWRIHKLVLRGETRSFSVKLIRTVLVVCALFTEIMIFFMYTKITIVWLFQDVRLWFIKWKKKKYKKLPNICYSNRFIVIMKNLIFLNFFILFIPIIIKFVFTLNLFC